MSIADKLRQSIGTDVEFESRKKSDEEMEAEAKERAQILAAYNARVNAPVNYKQYTPEEIYGIIERHPSLKVDAFNRRIIKLLCLYFTRDERCAANGLDVNKGLFLFGGTGVGKTTLMEFFRRNENHCFSVKPCFEIAIEYAKHTNDDKPKGWDIVPRYANNRDIVPSPANFGQSKSGYCFDDLGSEPETKNYGESARIMAPIIEARYGKRAFNSTHITTNITPDQIQDAYGKRVRSRMAEMFNIIQFPDDAPDRRKVKEVEE